MKRIVTGAAAGLSALGLAAGTSTSPALADAGTRTYTFSDCVGPAGTPSSFTAVKTALPEATGVPASSASAFRLDDGTVFVVLSFGDTFTPPGVPTSGQATVACTVSPGNATPYYSGFFA